MVAHWLMPSEDQRPAQEVPVQVVENVQERPSTGEKEMNKITNISDIRRYFHNNKDPVYFISATNFNLLGIGDWVGNFRHITYIDCFDGRQKNIFVPKMKFPGISKASRILTTTFLSIRRLSITCSPEAARAQPPS
tara:strand:+ start:761 stop:1168 length:408 start_codon:yes stop_codon:yes gene_type:complete